MSDMDMDKLASALVPGIISLFALLAIMGPEWFYSWLLEKITLYLILFLFFKIIANAFINRRLDRSEVKPLILGLALFIPYVFLTNMSPLEVLVSLFQVIAIISFFWVIFGSFKDKLSGK